MNGGRHDRPSQNFSEMRRTPRSFIPWIPRRARRFLHQVSGYSERGVCEEGSCERAARFQPESTAATVSELRRLADEGLRLRHWVAALTYEGEEGLNWADRKLFWHAFGVPVYEQYFDVSNQLLAMECDAHASLHLIRGCEDHRLDRETCACGDRTPRLSRGPRIEELVELLA